MKHLCLLLFFFTISLQAQFQVTGIVKDISTNKPLPFATITGNDGTNTISDVDGKFIILSKIPPMIVPSANFGSNDFNFGLCYDKPVVNGIK